MYLWYRIKNNHFLLLNVGNFYQKGNRIAKGLIWGHFYHTTPKSDKLIQIVFVTYFSVVWSKNVVKFLALPFTVSVFLKFLHELIFGFGCSATWAYLPLLAPPNSSTKGLTNKRSGVKRCGRGKTEFLHNMLFFFIKKEAETGKVSQGIAILLNQRPHAKL